MAAAKTTKRIVKSHIKHNGKLYAPKDTIELTEEEAASLEASLKPQAAVKAEAEAAKAEAEAKAKAEAEAAQG